MFSASYGESRHTAPAFGLSFGFHAALLLLLALVPATVASRMAPVHSERTVILVAPPVRALHAAPRLVLPRRIAISNAVVFQSARRVPAPELAPAPSLTLRSEPVAAPPINTPGPVAPPKPAVATGVFASIPAALATVSKPALPVNTGTFEIAAAGSDWSAPARTGRVAAAGFGSSYAGSNSAPALKAEVRSGGFATAVVAEPAAAPKPKPRSEPAPDSTVEILSKLQPAYTDEARRLRIEGDAVLEALFTAAGEVRVERLIRGLGYGLDEKAVEAAQHIRFKPARRNGEPVDCAAVVHITFQLAY